MKTETAERLRRTLWLGITASGAMIIYAGHQYDTVWKDKIDNYSGGPDAGLNLFLANIFLAVLSAFLCAAVGSFLSKRYNLPGVGGIKPLPPYAHWYLLVVPLAVPVGYILHDKVFIEGTMLNGWPQMIPDETIWAAALLLHGVFFKEVVFRYGLLTLFAGLFRGRHNWWAVGLTAAFMAGLSMRELSFAGYTPGYDLVTLSTFAWALLVNAALGAVYIKRGLAAAMLLRAMIDMRLIIYVILGVHKFYV